MNLLALMLGLALATPLADSGEEQSLEATEIFMGLFMHLEPHPVSAVWMGGSAGLAFVQPYPTGSDGEVLELDDHDHPVTFHSAQEFEDFYASRFAGGGGFLIYNINSVQWIAGGLLLLLLGLAASKSRRLGTNAPKGIGYQMIEATVLYVRDDMVYAVMGKQRGKRFVPLFLTQFFFILCLNLLGLVYLGSLGGTATANIAVTGALALTTFLWIHMSGIRDHGFGQHWKNFMPPGVPGFLLPLMAVVEGIGILVKPGALTVRLFANLIAGHLIMLSLFGLAYLAGGLFFGVPAVLSLLFAVAIGCLELFVAVVQAYIFTYLSIVFVGASVHPEH